MPAATRGRPDPVGDALARAEASYTETGSDCRWSTRRSYGCCRTSPPGP
ncbi:hypothetical protein ACR6C2_42235 [Streptomyces sp. INA 01156]